MKTKTKYSRNIPWTILVTVWIMVGSISCKKEYNSAGFTSGSGTPTITSVHTLSKSLADTLVSEVQTYDSVGNMTSVIDSNFAHQSIVAFDSATTTGNIGQYYVIYGSNLGSTTTIMFNGVQAYFNRSMITDKSIVVQIPSNVPTFGASATDSLTITTLHGTASYGFTILTPPPSINALSDYDFWAGSQITLKGVGFASVKSVGLTGTNDVCSIINQTDSVLTLQFPSTTINRANLIFSYTSEGNIVTTNSTIEFNDLDNAYTIFFKNNFQNSWADNSWAGPSGVSTNTTHSYNGTASAEASYPGNQWQIEGWANWYPSFAYDPSYKYMTFWVKGGTKEYTLTLVGDKMVGGYGQNQSPAVIQQIAVPPNVWTYYKIPLGTAGNELNYWATGSPAQELGFFLLGTSGDPDETMYFDEVAFLK